MLTVLSMRTIVRMPASSLNLAGLPANRLVELVRLFDQPQKVGLAVFLSVARSSACTARTFRAAASNRWS